MSLSPSSYNLDDSVFHPVPVFFDSSRLKKSAMAAMSRSEQTDGWILLYGGSQEHGVGNKGIILRGDDRRGDRNAVEDVTST